LYIDLVHSSGVPKKVRGSMTKSAIGTTLAIGGDTEVSEAGVWLARHSVAQRACLS
jgi:hypothetical protein